MISSTPEEDKYTQVVEGLAGDGWSVCEGFLSQAEVARLASEGRSLWSDGAFRRAGLGHGKSYQLRAEIRSDYVLWLDQENLTQDQQRLFHQLALQPLEQLRLAINRSLFLGLFELEAHLAFYPRGSHYRRHLDQFFDTASRKVSVILYLNEGWHRSDGGQLRLYQNREPDSPFHDIYPKGGTLVAFLSERFPHEVLPAGRERLSLTGWFKLRP